MNSLRIVRHSISMLAIGVCLVAGRAGAEDAPAQMPDNGKPHKVWTNELHVKATVVAIDHEKRTVGLKDPEGNVTTLEVGPSAKRFDAIQIGDTVTVSYLESMAIYVQSPNEAPAATGAASYMVSAKGKKPSGTIVHTGQITSTVEKINYKTREIVLRDSNGNKQAMVVGPEVKKLNQVKEGDLLVINATAAVAISVTKS